MKNPANRIIPPPKISQERINEFWRDYDAGKKRSTTRRMNGDERFMLWRKTGRIIMRQPWFDQRGRRTAEPVAVTPSVIGVVRNFRDADGAKKYAITTAKLAKVLNNNPAFDYQPAHILSVHAQRVLEMAIRAPTARDCNDRKLSRSLYGTELIRRLREKKVKLKEIIPSIEKAVSAIGAMNWGTDPHEGKILDTRSIDLHRGNILVIDYNPSTKKPLISFIDHTMY